MTAWLPGVALGALLALGTAAALAAEGEPAAGPEGAAGDEVGTLLTAPPDTGPAAGGGAPPLSESPVPAAERARVRRMANPMVGDPAALSKGRLLFAAHCQVCHGAADQGPPADAGFDPPPRDFRSVDYHAARTDGEIFYAILHGIDDSAMLPWEGRLTEREIWMVVAYLRSRAGTTP